MNTQFRCLEFGTPLTASRANFRRIVRPDEYPDLTWLDTESDRERLDAFHEGAWHMIGIQATTDILIPLDGYCVSQTISSPGLWGVESDAGEAHFDKVFAEECDSLAAMLGALGVKLA